MSMVPFAIDAEATCLVIHVSQLAAHTGNMLVTKKVSLMVMQAEVPGEPVHALARVSLEGTANRLTPESSPWLSARAAYLARFPDAEPMTQLGDFSFFAIHLSGARQIAGFGTARSLDLDEVRQVLTPH